MCVSSVYVRPCVFSCFSLCCMQELRALRASAADRRRADSVCCGVTGDGFSVTELSTAVEASLGGLAASAPVPRPPPAPAAPAPPQTHTRPAAHPQPHAAAHAGRGAHASRLVTAPPPAVVVIDSDEDMSVGVSVCGGEVWECPMCTFRSPGALLACDVCRFDLSA